MNNFLKLLPLIFFTLIFVSCDPGQEINFVNKTNSDLLVKIILKPNAQNYHLEQVAIKDSIVFNLKKDSIANISFGIGLWSGKDISNFVSSTKRIEFETKDIKTVYKSEKAIQDILSNNVKGIFVKNLIEINIE